MSLNATAAAVMLLPLADFPNDELAAMNNAIQTFGSLPPENMAHDRAVEASLVRPSGQPWDLEPLQAALAAEVNRRVEEGTFS